jgi:hypothetical protein
MSSLFDGDNRNWWDMQMRNDNLVRLVQHVTTEGCKMMQIVKDVEVSE